MNEDFLKQRDFFNRDGTRCLEFRLESLKKLKANIEKREKDLVKALGLDLGKPEFEAYSSEIGLVYKEINHILKNLKKWARPKRRSSPIYLMPARSFIMAEPKGQVLIVSPWNYPFLLAISPLAGAIASGNTVFIKPSFKSKHTNKLIGELISETFSKDHVKFISGPGASLIPKLIDDNDFDHIFFTGSKEVGRSLARQAGDKLIPISLELGGKSPLIVDKTADIEMSAKRIAWGKFFNLGQTCVAPDYLLVDRTIEDQLTSRIIEKIQEFYGPSPEKSKDLGFLVDHKAYLRLESYLNQGDLVYGGYRDPNRNFIGPSLIKPRDLNQPLMREEIFGPILPIIAYDSLIEAREIISKNPDPLALYMFSESKDNINYILDKVAFGGGSINDILSHLANINLPFGGRGESGQGAYHGQYSFYEFSHMKSVLRSYSFLDNNIKYPPYKDSKLKVLKKFLK